MVPVAAVPRDAGRLEAKHRADLAGAKPGDKPFETRAGDGATGRQTEIVVDDVDPGETVPARHLDKIVLAALALEVVSHLCRRGLTDIDDSYARQHRLRQGIRRPHCHPPLPGRSQLAATPPPARRAPRPVSSGSSRATSARPASCSVGKARWAAPVHSLAAVNSSNFERKSVTDCKIIVIVRSRRVYSEFSRIPSSNRMQIFSII